MKVSVYKGRLLNNVDYVPTFKRIGDDAEKIIFAGGLIELINNGFTVRISK